MGMTPKEAHYWLEEKQRMMTQYRHLFSSEDVEANGIAILAIEKQIPKKPNGTDRAYIMRCPNCSAVVMQNLSSEQTDYCIRCGQAIDWAEDNR